MVGWGREMLPVGSGQALGTVAAVMLTRVRGDSCAFLLSTFFPGGSGNTAQFPVSRREVQDYGGGEELAEWAGDLARRQDHEYLHVITCQT